MPLTTLIVYQDSPVPTRGSGRPVTKRYVVLSSAGGVPGYINSPSIINSSSIYRVETFNCCASASTSDQNSCSKRSRLSSLIVLVNKCHANILGKVSQFTNTVPLTVSSVTLNTELRHLVSLIVERPDNKILLFISDLHDLRAVRYRIRENTAAKYARMIA